ncbi:MAG: hypothetical protein K6E12_10185 [Saccharofermentans sp.]|nr:hypothetical protein [Saccharofermentans sp.]
MAMQTNLSKKDKTTIALVLFAALLFAIIWFLIRPTVSSIITLDDRIEQAEVTRSQYKNKLINLTSAEAIYAKTVSDLNESTSCFYEVMDSSAIDRMITSYALESGLFAESLSIKMPDGPVEESPYRYYESAYSGNADTGMELTDSSTDLLSPYNAARRSVRSSQSSGVMCVGVTLVVTGSRGTCQAFIDDICTKDAVRITSFDWEEVDMISVYNEETGMMEYKDPGIVRLKISFNLYMADVTDYEASLTDALDQSGDSEV